MYLQESRYRGREVDLKEKVMRIKKMTMRMKLETRGWAGYVWGREVPIQGAWRGGPQVRRAELDRACST